MKVKTFFIFRDKGKIVKKFRKSENFSEIGGKSQTGMENASWSQGGWTPLYESFKI